MLQDPEWVERQSHQLRQWTKYYHLHSKWKSSGRMVGCPRVAANIDQSRSMYAGPEARFGTVSYSWRHIGATVIFGSRTWVVLGSLYLQPEGDECRGDILQIDDAAHRLAIIPEFLVSGKTKRKLGGIGESRINYHGLVLGALNKIFCFLRSRSPAECQDGIVTPCIELVYHLSLQLLWTVWIACHQPEFWHIPLFHLEYYLLYPNGTTKNVQPRGRDWVRRLCHSGKAPPPGLLHRMVIDFLQADTWTRNFAIRRA